jgi:hypothetical protein
MRAHGIDVSDPDPTTGDMTTPHSTTAEAENDPLQSPVALYRVSRSGPAVAS